MVVGCKSITPAIVVAFVALATGVLLLSDDVSATHGRVDVSPRQPIELGPVAQQVELESHVSNPRATRQLDVFAVGEIVYVAQPAPSGAALRFDLDKSRHDAPEQTWLLALRPDDPTDGSVLRFVADAGAELPNDSVSTVSFRLVFDVIGHPPIGSRLPVEVTGYETATGWRSQWSAPSLHHSVVVITDGPPQVDLAEADDIDGDGVVDAYVIGFDEPVRADTMHANGFLFDGSRGTSWQPWDRASGAAAAPGAANAITAALVHFSPAAGAAVGHLPEVAYDHGPDGAQYAIFDFDEQFLRPFGPDAVTETRAPRLACPDGGAPNPSGTTCLPDGDGDRVPDDGDLCPSVYDPYQDDLDGDGEGDACDEDDDGDGILDGVDNCARVVNGDQVDTDHDGAGDACDDDDDGDGVRDGQDNCPRLANADQADLDWDGEGDACDDDDDGDGVPDSVDNCPRTYSRTHLDVDGDGTGYACDERLDIGPVSARWLYKFYL